MGFPLGSEFENANHGEAGISKQAMTSIKIKPLFCGVPIVTDFIRNRKREFYDENLEVYRNRSKSRGRKKIGRSKD